MLLRRALSRLENKYTRFWGIPKQVLIQLPAFLQLARALSSLDVDLYRRIIELFVSARRDADVTQQELGKRLGQRQTVISKIETMERRIDVAEFVLLCRAIGADPYLLLRQAEGL
jgi:DNA-binding XRE family transcriptional regulator